MVNHLVLLINLIGLLLIDPFFLADISITQTIPTQMAPGSEVRVTVTVNKSTLSGFAKLQLDLPPGLTATAIETKGASFTFADQKAKFIWMALPSTPTFKVSYTLSADASVSGNLAVQGRLSYIEDNERKTFDLPTSTIDFGLHTTTPIAAATPTVVETPNTPEPVAVTTATVDPTASDLVSAGAGAPAAKTFVAVVDQASGVAPMQGMGGVEGSRTITPVSEKEMLVEVIIKKGDIRGFGKLQESIPAGFTALEKTSSEAIFTTHDQIAKFVWLNLPSSSEIKVVYRLRANDNPEGDYSIDGEFGYLLNDETQKAVLGTSRFFIGPKPAETTQPVAQTPVKEVPPPVVAKVEPVVAKATPPPPPVKETPKPKVEAPVVAQQTPKPAAQPKSAIPAPEKGILYKVQISAGHREVGRTYFSSRHRFNGDFNVERHQGWIKYVTGRYGSYNEARDQRVAYVSGGHNFPGPFVTAYNNGDRITVQEALLLSNQKWVQ